MCLGKSQFLSLLLCSVSTIAGAATLETVDVNISGSGYFSSAGTYAPGDYLLTVSGEYIFDSTNLRYSDALFSYRDSQRDDPNLWTLLSFDRLVLVDNSLVESTINWQSAANLSHTYSASVAHAGGSFDFRLFDGFYPDNVSFGQFTVDIGSQVPAVPLPASAFGLGAAMLALTQLQRRKRRGASLG